MSQLALALDAEVPEAEPPAPAPFKTPAKSPCSELGAVCAVAGSEPCAGAMHWSDELMDMLDAANHRAELEVRRLKEMHAKIEGCTVEELDAKMQEREQEEREARSAARATKPPRPSKGKPSDEPIKLGMAALSERQRDLLKLVSVEDNFAVYTGTERIPDWDLLKRVMLALGGSWSRQTKRRPGGFAFADDADAAELVRLALETGEVLDPKAADFFPTPAALADLLVERAGVDASSHVLEPSAGTGAIAAAVMRRAKSATVYCFEALEQNRQDLRLAYFTVDETEDFLSVDPAGFARYSHVCMNPPFGKRGDIHHVRHAYKFLAPGGTLVAIMSAGVKFREDKLATEFRAFVKANDGFIWNNEDGAFRESGTGVRTVMVRLRKAV